MNKEKIKKKSRILGALLIVGMLWAGIAFAVISNNSNPKFKVGSGDILETTDEIDYEEEGEWHLIQEIHMLDPLGEATNQPGESQWLSFFMLDYGETPGTVLANNATDWSAAATARGYADTDGWDLDLKAGDNGYWVCRCKFNETHLDGGATEMNWSRMKVKLNITGDSIGQVYDIEEYDNSSNSGSGGGGAHAGDVEVSQEGTEAGERMVWANFWWDDNDDGYGIDYDGSLSVSIYLYAKF